MIQRTIIFLCRSGVPPNRQCRLKPEIADIPREVTPATPVKAKATTVKRRDVAPRLVDQLERQMHPRTPTIFVLAKLSKDVAPKICVFI